MNRWGDAHSFFCVVAAREGGCSPVVDCRRVYQQLDPVVRQMFEEKGLMYVRNFSDGLDVSWQHFFQTDDCRVVEEACSAQGFICEWVGKDDLRVNNAAGRCFAIRRLAKWHFSIRFSCITCTASILPSENPCFRFLSGRPASSRLFRRWKRNRGFGDGSRGRGLREECGSDSHGVKRRYGNARQHAHCSCARFICCDHADCCRFGRSGRWK